MTVFQLAVKPKAYSRTALVGPPGSGKTYTALSLATHIARSVALIDTEYDRSLRYAGDFRFFQVGIRDCHPANIIELIHQAKEEGHDGLILDSFSSPWIGRSGILWLVDKATRAGERPSAQDAWREVNPLHQELLDTLLGIRMHVFTTLRTKNAYTQEQRLDPVSNTIRSHSYKVGLQPIQRDGIEYEFEWVAEMDHTNTLTFTKSLYPKLQHQQFPFPGRELAVIMKGCLDDGMDVDQERLREEERRKRELRDEIRGKVKEAGRDERQMTDYIFALYGRSSLYSLEVEELREVCSYLDERIEQAGRAREKSKTRERKSEVIVEEGEGLQQVG